MRIYNKKGFASGIFMVFLGSINLIYDVIDDSIETKGMVLTTVLLLFGVDSIMRSLSEKMAREDRQEDADEKNHLVELKSKSKSFQLTQGLSFLLMLILLVAGKISGFEGAISMAVGMAFVYAISMFSEIFTYIYYSRKI